MHQQLKLGLSQFLVSYYDSLIPTTVYMDEFVARGSDKSIGWAPSRMMDKAEEMLASFQRNDTYPGDTKPYKLPVILVAMARDYIPTTRDFGRGAATASYVSIPGDSKERVFKMRTVQGDIRVQLAICAPELVTAQSIAAQLHLFMEHPANRRFKWQFSYAQTTDEWVAQVESPELMATHYETDNKNLVILAVDLTIKTTIPLMQSPAVGEPNDGKGVPGTDDPAGYPVVIEVDAENQVTGYRSTVTAN